MQKHIKRIISSSFFRYVFMGGIAFVTDYGLLLFTYYALSLPLPVATTIGFVSGMAVSFAANRYWVFGKGGTQRYIGRQGVEYSLLVVFNYLFTVVSVNYLHHHGIQPYISKVLVMLLILCWNYVLFSKVIFRDTRNTPFQS